MLQLEERLRRAHGVLIAILRTPCATEAQYRNALRDAYGRLRIEPPRS